MHRIYTLRFGAVYPLYVAKVEKKGRTREELHEVLRWLSGYDEATLAQHIAGDTTFAEFFGGATLNPAAALVTGVVCGVRVEQIEDPLMKQIRILDKLVDELARGRALNRVLRSA